ncbi:MAG: hypothetical protein WD928_05090 [Gammaproteobacteria bacterium]
MADYVLATLVLLVGIAWVLLMIGGNMMNPGGGSVRQNEGWRPILGGFGTVAAGAAYWAYLLFGG